MSTIPEEIKTAINLAQDSFRAGHDEGYRLGYREGFAAAMDRAKELVDKTLGPLVEPPKERK